MKQMTLDDFKSALQRQGVDKEDFAFTCPICGTIQSARDLIAAGAGKTFDDVEGYVAFSCVGRWLGTGPFKELETPPGKGCDWTLGGVFSLHKLEVITPDGKTHPRFAPVSPEDAQAHAGRGAE